MHRSTRPVAGAVLSATALLALAACGGGEPTAEAATTTGGEVTVAHAQGETTVPVDPETVVVFDVGVLSTLDSLGVEVAGVPDAVFPGSLAEYGGGEDPKKGFLFEPDYEAGNPPEPHPIIVSRRAAAGYSPP